MVLSAEYMSNFDAFLWQWWCLHMIEKFWRWRKNNNKPLRTYDIDVYVIVPRKVKDMESEVKNWIIVMIQHGESGHFSEFFDFSL